MAERKTAVTATGTVQSNKGYYYGYTVTTALSAAAVTVYDNTSAAGTVVDVIAASTAAGVTKIFAEPVPLSIGLHAVVAGTGTVLFLHD
jgi:bifunctional ADP-heptose synthase (sugar kinase/adenylyltransferase)